MSRDLSAPLPDPELIRHAIDIGREGWAARLTVEWAHRCRSLGYLRPELLRAIREGDSDRAALCARLVGRAADLMKPKALVRANRPVLRFPTAAREIAAEFAGFGLGPVSARRPSLEELDGDNTEDRAYE